MCGIAGIVRTGDKPVFAEEIKTLTDALVHRGPDEDGMHLDCGVGLGIRRLRIIDLVTGSQPIANEDRTVWTVLNGEIYNFAALRSALSARGHRFSTQTDTECIVHAYEEYGVDCVKHLHGMFAFAVWDSKAKRLLLARDRLGKKPLAYADLAGEFIFSSEFQSLLKHPRISRDIDFGALGEYLVYGYVPAPASIYQAVRKLQPGCRLIWEQGETKVERYWQASFEPKQQLSEAEALEMLRTKLTEAVRLRLVADVPIGALLSGGIDSSVIVALMASFSPGKIKTFSIGFEQQQYNELAHARRVARRYGTDHHEFIVKPDAAAVVGKLVKHYGEPYADSSMIPTYYVNQLARQHVTVALNGDGGDESFAGYDRYRAMGLAEVVRRVCPSDKILSALSRLAGSMVVFPERTRMRAARFLGAASLAPGERHAKWVTAHPTDAREDVLRPEIAQAVEAQRQHTVERLFESLSGLSLTDRQLAVDLQTYLPGDLLVKMDIASMASSLETRSPLLDQEVVAFAASLPAELKLHRGTQKYLLKQLAKQLIPIENINRPKMGFGVPIREWLRGPLRRWAEELLFSADARNKRFFEPESIRQLWQTHQAGVLDRTFSLWTVLMFEAWHREFMTAPGFRCEAENPVYAAGT